MKPCIIKIETNRLDKSYHSVSKHYFLRFDRNGSLRGRKPDERAGYPHEAFVFRNVFTTKLFNYCLN